LDLALVEQASICVCFSSSSCCGRRQAISTSQLSSRSNAIQIAGAEGEGRVRLSSTARLCAARGRSSCGNELNRTSDRFSRAAECIRAVSITNQLCAELFALV